MNFYGTERQLQDIKVIPIKIRKLFSVKNKEPTSFWIDGIKHYKIKYNCELYHLQCNDEHVKINAYPFKIFRIIKLLLKQPLLTYEQDNYEYEITFNNLT